VAMTYFDIFNGDADGICALHQLRLHEPRSATLITGVKRDISLLSRTPATSGDQLTVLDISLNSNREALQQHLAQAIDVQYFDHHFAGDIPLSEHLFACIDPSAEVCTSLLVNQHLGGAHVPWAVVGAFGDNLHAAARLAAAPLALDDAALNQLEHLGMLLNYNGYGVTEDDLWLHPADLYRAVSAYANPFDFITQSPAYRLLDEGYHEDIAHSNQLETLCETTHTAAFVLPDEPWARRVSGVLGNQLACAHPDRAHALLTALEGDIYRVSVRAPLSNKNHADTLCMQFPTGGGRKGAAGINALPREQLDDFITAFGNCYE